MRASNEALMIGNQTETNKKSQEKMEAQMKKTEAQTTEQRPQKLHIQKVQPAGGTQTVSDPGGCRPTGT